MDNLSPKDIDLTEDSSEEVKDSKTNFEIYCDENPDALECRIYDN